MPRVNAHERGGLFLLDLLYRNNLVVHCSFTPQEQQILAKIAHRFRLEVEGAGFSGLEAERLIHCGLCMVEVFAADDGEVILNHHQFGGLPAGMTREQFIDAKKSLKNIMGGVSMGFAGIRIPSAKRIFEALMDLALDLADALKEDAADIRLRLTERVFAAEFPDAPINVFSWLSALRVIEPGAGKFSRPADASAFAYEDQAFRAALLVEFESVRKWLWGVSSHKETIKGLYSKLVTTRDESTIEAMSKWEDAVGERVHLPKLKNKIVHINHAKWGLREQGSVRNTIARFPELAPGYQGFLTKKSTALTDIAGAMIRTHPWSEEQIGLGKFSHTSESKAELVQEELAKRGFTVGARTIHIHNEECVQKHVDLLDEYTMMIRIFPFVPSAETEDSCLIRLYGRERKSSEHVTEK